MESVACGTPVIASNVCGIPGIITSCDFGLLSERTKEVFAANIQKAFDASWAAFKIVNYARRFSRENVPRSMFDIFQQVTSYT